MAILVMWPRRDQQTFVPPTHLGFIWAWLYYKVTYEYKHHENIPV